MTEVDPKSKNESKADEDCNEIQVIKESDIEGEKNNSKKRIYPSENLSKVKNSEKLNSTEFFQLALKDLEEKRTELESDIKDLEKRKIKLEKEVSQSFSGQSDSIARRVKGFQDYLTGALQDLSQSVEQLELIAQPVVVTPSPLDKTNIETSTVSEKAEEIAAIADTFKPDKDLILQLLGQYIEGPDYYANPWKFRRSLDAQDAEILEDWFFNMGGRGAQPSLGNRSKNVQLSAALIAILGELYGDRFQALVLASQPERLGEWRRGLQDALGLNREDFGPNSGVVLFERAEPLIERADRLEAENEVPLILIDAAERNIEIPILQFPIWLAFAATNEELYLEEELI
ncbi:MULTISPECIES: DUF3086 domain-containing protein [Prochlorococcus]|uniref:DUF3086 domain-containing protein n=1 Tax=Prochlorococcus marinus (strain SARG / CCMP1375 / SS120) TaxID=167539 RepID=Q7VAQ0_PROMA|nr:MULTISPECIES: DUF3086 domain-containing protein [Prochlorococcus]AAQ00451.1 Uncharacterized protein Pro_1407 [Prochlorococcus marinus subsp. marinus str. CCMP1375]KGG14332.1 hypothetical protein EV04_0185 [Prochlorococcus marinus str. LG]KGG22094.1 hypothetical protein EV08_0268 [Prochlorococcus marinus str. SS2]KGG24588.1 hypothetical protein EV09_0220 [Prochlorococcus marinus str. SS35]KGG33481.1 hypothetical protein EV10_0690 [Prochlorococcus marinus str. SS51]